MAENKSRKGHRSGAHGDARKAITRKNKERKAKQYAKWLAKRQAINLANAQPKPEPRGRHAHKKPEIFREEFIVRLHADGSVHDGLTVEGAMPDAYFYPHKDQEDARITFLTRKNKKWTMKLSEFSFIINRKAPVPFKEEVAAAIETKESTP